MTSKVSIVKNDDVQNLVSEALSLADFEEHVRPNTKVFVKINALRAPKDTEAFEGEVYERSRMPEGELTHPEIGEALLRCLVEAGVSDITVGEGAGGCATDIPYRHYGWYEITAKYGARLADLNYEPSIKVPVPQPYVLEYIWVPKLILESDLVISVPIMKTHGSTCVTLSLKNMMGVLPGYYYGWNKAASYRSGVDKPIPHSPVHPSPYGENDTISGLVVDICSVVRIGFSLIDGLTVIHRDCKDRPDRVNLVIAGSDPVAVDSVGAAVMGFDPSEMLELNYAAQRGLGTNELSQIDLVGVPIDQVQLRCPPPRPEMEGLQIG